MLAAPLTISSLLGATGFSLLPWYTQPLPFISSPTKLNQTGRGKTTAMEEEWSAEANEAAELSLISTTSGKPIATFHPQFTYRYAIFGDSENIFGYKDPNLQIAFAANDMKCCLDIS